MTGKEAMDHMNCGGRVTRKNWLSGDYLYISKDEVYCDDGRHYLGSFTSTKGGWIKYEEMEGDSGI